MGIKLGPGLFFFFLSKFSKTANIPFSEMCRSAILRIESKLSTGGNEHLSKLKTDTKLLLRASAVTDAS